jgi:hypothetical protein
MPRHSNKNGHGAKGGKSITLPSNSFIISKYVPYVIGEAIASGAPLARVVVKKDESIGFFLTLCNHSGSMLFMEPLRRATAQRFFNNSTNRSSERRYK